jgi:hypothetical protein
MPDLPVPGAPTSPRPKDGGSFGFNGGLMWSPAYVGDPPERATAYEIYISPRADLAWPVAPNTHRIIEDEVPVFRLLFPDVLRQGATYYWRVRGRSTAGLWGPWSDTWSFIARGPEAPNDLRAEFEPETGTAKLVWRAADGGTPAMHYELYGSGEQGFSPIAGCQPEAHAHGRTFQRPSTLIRRVNELSADVTARPEVFYRLRSVDADGNISAPTKIVTLPSPALLPVELPQAGAGEPYEAQIPARLRTWRDALSLKHGMIRDGADDPTFTLQDNGGADWLTLDAETGELTGTPAAAGNHGLKIELSDGRGGRTDREYILIVR